MDFIDSLLGQQKISEDNKVEEGQAETSQIMEITLHSINEITRDTDMIGKVDPYVIVSANGQIIGKTEPVTNATSAIVNKLFIIKAKEGVDPLSIKFTFDLMDEDQLTKDDALGSGFFNPAEEEVLVDQTVYLKYEGKEIGSITISINMKEIHIIG